MKRPGIKKPFIAGALTAVGFVFSGCASDPNAETRRIGNDMSARVVSPDAAEEKPISPEALEKLRQRVRAAEAAGQDIDLSPGLRRQLERAESEQTAPAPEPK